MMNLIERLQSYMRRSAAGRYESMVEASHPEGAVLPIPG